MRSEDVDARGMTDILAPLKLALAMLEGVQGGSACSMRRCLAVIFCSWSRTSVSKHLLWRYRAVAELNRISTCCILLADAHQGSKGAVLAINTVLMRRCACTAMAQDCITPSRVWMRAGIPYVFLLTDGAVDNERSICRHMEAYQARTPAPGALHARVSTFAIGPFCNHFFLKQLAASGSAVQKLSNAVRLSSALLRREADATEYDPSGNCSASVPIHVMCIRRHRPRIQTFALTCIWGFALDSPSSTEGIVWHAGRGASDVAFRAGTIEQQMLRMLAAASHPVLTEVSNAKAAPLLSRNCCLLGVHDSCVRRLESTSGHARDIAFVGALMLLMWLAAAAFRPAGRPVLT